VEDNNIHSASFMSDKKNAFSSPTVASLQRLGRRSPPRSKFRSDQSDCNSEASSVAKSHYSRTSRRSASVIQTHEDAELFDNLSGSTGVKLVRQRKDVDDESDPGSQIIDVVEGALNLLRSLSPTSPRSRDGSNMDGYTPGLPASLRARQDLDLRNNDNSFHVLASLLVEFFQQRVQNRRLTLLPDDRRTIERLLPESARQPFIEAVQYRLASTPVAPRTPLHFLTLQCQELGFHLYDDANPILAACQMTNEPLSLAVLKVLESDEDDDIDATSNHNVKEISSPKSSSFEDIKLLGNSTHDEVAESIRGGVSTAEEFSDDEACIDNAETYDDASAEERNKFKMSTSISTALTGNKQYLLMENGIQIEETVGGVKGTTGSKQSPTRNINKSPDKVGYHTNSQMELPSNVEFMSIHPNILVEPTPTAVNDVTSQEIPVNNLLSPQLQFTPKERYPNENNKVSISENKANASNETKRSGIDSSPYANPARENDKRTYIASVGSEPPPKSPKSHTRSTSNSPQRMSSDLQSSPQYDNRYGADYVTTGKRNDDGVDKSNPLIFTSQSTVEWFSSLFSSSVSLDPSSTATMEKHRNFSVPDNNGRRYMSQIQPGSEMGRIKPINPFDAYPEAMHDDSLNQNGKPVKFSKDHVPTRFKGRDALPSIPLSIDGPSASRSVSETLQSTILMNRPENLAQRQLWIELKEATALMEQSQNTETERFWLEHVLDLQSRLKEMQGEKSGSSLPPIPDTGPDENAILEQNRRLISDMQQRERNVAPALSAKASSEASGAVVDIPYKVSMSSSRNTPVEASCSPIDQEVDYDMPMVDVIAPADLPGGYHFEAEIEGQRFLATVPAGGVRQGEAFTCYMRELGSVAIEIPFGYWKDNMMQVCRYGLCHCAVVNTIFCPLITLSQIQFRTKLDFLGRPRLGPDGLSNRALMVSIIAFWTVSNLLLFIACNLKWSRGLELSNADIAAFSLINTCMLGFLIFVTQATRSSIREKFMIREERCLDLEDICCAVWCLPCTVCHMARHTADYDEYEAVCCSKTGLPDGVRVSEMNMSYNTKATNSDVYLL
jgi:Cys-rich protein (TIGR01571 family)